MVTPSSDIYYILSIAIVRYAVIAVTYFIPQSQYHFIAMILKEFQLNHVRAITLM